MKCCSKQVTMLISLKLHFTAGTDQQCYNLPTSSEVAVIISGTYSQKEESRDVVLHLKAGPLKWIYETHPAYQPLLYVLLFPRGEHGWHSHIPLTLEDGQAAYIPEHHEDENRDAGEEPDNDDDQDQPNGKRKPRTTLSQLEYYAYRLHQCKEETESDHIFRSKGLLQQYIVDAWAQTDQSRLNWLKNNQDKLRADVYQGLVDAVSGNADANLAELGQHFILPSSYIGGSRNMFQLYQDSSALARFFGKPDFFLTIICSPLWEEIKNELFNGQEPNDRPDLVTRVF